MGFSSGNYSTFHEGNGHEWTESHSARYGADTPLPQTSPKALEAIRRENDERYEARSRMVAQWNEIGQYVKIGDFVYPFEVRGRLGEYDHRNIHAYIKSSLAYYETSVKCGKESICIYRLADADASDPWLMQGEFHERTRCRPTMNTKSHPWW